MVNKPCRVEMPGDQVQRAVQVLEERVSPLLAACPTGYPGGHTEAELNTCHSSLVSPLRFNVQRSTFGCVTLNIEHSTLNLSTVMASVPLAVACRPWTVPARSAW